MGDKRARTTGAVLALLALVGLLFWLRASGGRGSFAEVSLAAPAPPASAGSAVELSAPEIPGSARRDASEDDGPHRTEAEPESKPPATPDRPSRAAGARHQANEALTLRGRVLFPDRSGAKGASVVFGPWRTRAGEEGRFELALEERAASPLGRSATVFAKSLGKSTALMAFLDGWVPAVLQVGPAVAAAHQCNPPGTLDPVELVLPGVALTITGTLLDRTGSPAEGWRIALLDGTPVYLGAHRPYSTEEVASGAVTDATRGEDAHVATRADGRFRFAGLAVGRSYRVRAWNSKTLEQAQSEPILAGTQDVILRAPTDPLRPIVDGVVVGLDGSPLAGVICRLSMDEYRTDDGGTWGWSVQQVETDASGRFELQDVPRSEVFLRFKSPTGGDLSIPLPSDDQGRNLRVELVRTGVFVFELSSKGRAPDTLRVLDDAGEQLTMEVDTGPGTSSSGRDLAPSSDGTCQAHVSELARWLALLQKGREIARLPLLIRHGEETPVRW